MFKVNKDQGSFYLQSKVYRAWERLDEEYTKEGKKSPEDVSVQEQAQQQQQQQQEERK
jgi:import inner membrane translocase subunit TIM16